MEPGAGDHLDLFAVGVDDHPKYGGSFG